MASVLAERQHLSRGNQISVENLEETSLVVKQQAIWKISPVLFSKEKSVMKDITRTCFTHTGNEGQAVPIC